MKLFDIVSQLRTVLPKHTDKFSTLINTISIDVTSNVAVVTTDVSHRLKDTEIVTLTGYSTKTQIQSVQKVGLLVTFTTVTDHDLTENWHETVNLNGFDSTSWNDSFELFMVPNRKQFVVRSTNDIPILNSNEYILEDRIDGINGRFQITYINANSFSITGDFLNGSYSEGVINTKVRIVGSINMERFLDHYTEQNVNDLYMVVVMDDADVSKDRNTYSDAIATPVTGSEIRLQLIDGFMIYVFGDASNNTAAQDIIDICRHDLLLPILKSVYGSRFVTGLTNETDFRTVFGGHGLAYYDKSKYVHGYKFELSMEITADDAVEDMDTRAYRDTETNITVDEQIMEITVNQDDVPYV